MNKLIPVVIEFLSFYDKAVILTGSYCLYAKHGMDIRSGDYNDVDLVFNSMGNIADFGIDLQSAMIKNDLPVSTEAEAIGEGYEDLIMKITLYDHENGEKITIDCFIEADLKIEKSAYGGIVYDSIERIAHKKCQIIADRQNKAKKTNADNAVIAKHRRDIGIIYSG